MFLGCEIEIFLVSQILVRRFGGLSVGERYWIWSLLYGGHRPASEGLNVPTVCTSILCLTLIDAMTFVLSNASL